MRLPCPSPRHVLLLALAAALALPAASAQPAGEPAAAPAVTVEAGLTLASRFIYRGINLGEAPQVQPRLSLNVGDFQFSLWGSHPLSQPSDENVESPRDANYREVLFWALYTFDVGIGTLTPYVQNHYNPNVGDLFDFAADGEGAHFLQAQLMFSGDERLPVDAMVGYVFYNDPGRSIYLEGGYRFTRSDLAFRAFAGGVLGESPFNGVSEDRPAFTNIGLTAARTLAISDVLSLPVGVSFIFNPYTEDAFAIFTVSLF